MKNTCKLILFICLVSFGCKKDETVEEPPVNYLGTWELKSSSLVSKRMKHVGVAVNGYGYIGLGNEYSTSLHYLHDWWEYNPLSDSWTQKAVYPGIGHGIQKAFGTLQNAYVIDSGQVYSFSPANNSWTQLNNFPGILRDNYFLTGTDSGAFLGMGSTDTFPSSPLSDWWKYNESTDQWTQQTSFTGLGLYNPLGFLLNNKIYIGLGSYSSYCDFNLWAYSIDNDQWNLVCSTPTKNRSGFGFTLNGKGYFVGGILSILKESLSEYDFATNTWKFYYDVKCSGGAYFTVNNKFYLFQNWTKYIQDETSMDEKFWVLTP